MIASRARFERYHAVRREIARDVDGPMPDWQRAARVAGIWHLVDLKRAGHSPRRTELANPPDAALTRIYRPEPPRSLFGSSALMAMEG